MWSAIAALCVGAAPSAGMATAAETPTGPIDRIVLITVDTLRADHVGAYGGPVPTPELDRLAAEGVLVEQACTPVPSTGPAHVSLLTGRYPWHHGTLKNAVPMDPRIPTLSEALGERGMRTGAFVSSYILHRRFGFHQGFDDYVFEPTESYEWRGKLREGFWTRGEHTTRAAMQWLTEHGSEPFFLWVHYFDPHKPYLPPPGYALAPDTPIDLGGKTLPESVRGPGALRRLILAYRGEVAYTDAQIGRLVERLRLLDLLDRTAIVVTADHGEGLGDHGVLEHGLNLFDELVRVPLIVRAPGLPPGRRLAGDAQLEDLAPTLLAMVGAEPPSDLDGVSLLGWLRGDVPQSPRRAAVGRRRPYQKFRDRYFQRSWPQKWIGTLDAGGSATFDLSADPRERKPTSAEGPPALLREALAGVRADAGAEASQDPDPEVRRALEALGYVEE